MRHGPLALLLLPLLVGCPSDRLLQTEGALSVRPEELDFGQVWVGHPGRGVVAVQNTSRTAVTVTVRLEGPFTSEGTRLHLPGAAEVDLALFAHAWGTGALAGTLTLETEGGGRVVPLSAVAVVPPGCDTAHPCRSEHFDPEQGRCVGVPRPDDTPCAETSACLVGATCQDGACRGEPVFCGDGNPCTLDACEDTHGCVHIADPAQVCPASADPCKVPFCDPQSGCGVADVADGVSCGPADCVSANVCIAGACKAVPVPEGAACGQGSPCQAAGTCSNGHCIQPIPNALQPVWTYAPPAHIQLSFEGVADAQENLYWTECESQCKASDCPRCDTVSANRDGVIRWRSRIHHGGLVTAQDAVLRQFVSGDALFTFLGNTLTVAQRRSDGQTLWMRNLAADHGGALFDAAVPEAERRYTLGSPGADAQGRVVVPLEGTRVIAGHATHTGLLVVALDPQTGGTLWQALEDGRYGRVASGLSGETFVASDDPWLPGQQSPLFTARAFTSAGQVRWQMPATQAAYPAVFGGSLVLAGVEALDVTSGASRWAHAPGVVAPAVVGGGRVWSLRWRPGSGAYQLVQWDLLTGAANWMLDMDQTQWVGDLVLTDAAEMLMVRTYGDFVGSEYLVKVSPQGQEVWHCPLPMLAHHAHLTPFAGRVVTEVVHAQASLAAFDVPGLKLAPSGWMVSHGAPERSGRPR